MPIRIAAAHYDACDALGLTDQQQFELGSATFARVRGSVLGTVLRAGRKAGITPWFLLPQLQRFWNRAYDGGGIRIERLGAAEALVDVVACPLLEKRQYRNSLRATLHAVVELFGRKAFVTERKGSREEGAISLRAQWA